MPASADDRIAIELSSPSGLRASFNANGSLRRLECGATALALFVGNEIEGGPTNLYLRRHADDITWTPLLGPSSPTHFVVDPQGTALLGGGTWGGIGYVIEFRLAAAAKAWFWRVRLQNLGASRQTLDLTYAQDLALALWGGTPERVLRQPVSRSHRSVTSHARDRDCFASEPCRRRPPTLELDWVARPRRRVRDGRPAVPWPEPCSRSGACGAHG